jgi:hypothetical protein
MNDLVIALAGGAVGSLVTWGFGLAARWRAIPSEIEEHDRLARHRDEDLAQWVADDHLRLSRELSGIVVEKAAVGLLYSGSLASALNFAKERALHAYRDQERQALRFVDELAAQETWFHRKQSRRSPLGLTAPRRVQPVLDRWRDPAWGQPPGVVVLPFDDPTQRTLENTIAVLEPDAAAQDPATGLL